MWTVAMKHFVKITSSSRTGLLLSISTFSLKPVTWFSAGGNQQSSVAFPQSCKSELSGQVLKIVWFAVQHLQRLLHPSKQDFFFKMFLKYCCKETMKKKKKTMILEEIKILCVSFQEFILFTETHFLTPYVHFYKNICRMMMLSCVCQMSVWMEETAALTFMRSEVAEGQLCVLAEVPFGVL